MVEVRNGYAVSERLRERLAEESLSWTSIEISIPGAGK